MFKLNADLRAWHFFFDGNDFFVVVCLDPERVKTLENEKKRIRDAQQKKYEEQAKKTMAERKKAKRAKALEQHEKKKFNANDHDHFDSEYNPLMGGSSGRCVSSPPAPRSPCAYTHSCVWMLAFVHASLHIFTYIFALQVRGLLDVSRESPREVVDEAKSIFPENVV